MSDTGKKPMPVTSLDTFDTTIHKTNAWLNELRQELGWDDRHAAYLALRATLHALRDRITVEEVAQLGAQLPMLVRGFYYEGWDPTARPLKQTRQQFLDRIGEQFKGENVDPEAIAGAVFAVLEHRIAEGEIQDVMQVLPLDLRNLWPARV